MQWKVEISGEIEVEADNAEEARIAAGGMIEDSPEDHLFFEVTKIEDEPDELDQSQGGLAR
jgi:hypothetical protein